MSGVIGVKVPPGTAPGRRLRVRGEGLLRLDRGGRGDLDVIIVLDLPESPSRRVREALEALRAAEKDDVGPTRKRYGDLLRDHRREAEKKKAKK